MNWGTDHPGITSISSKINLKPYFLTKDGEVKNPVILIWMDVLALSKTLSVSHFHCVEGWSVLNCGWEGVRLKK
jgi:sulfoxide reductase catalytic subunit YedY